MIVFTLSIEMRTYSESNKHAHWTQRYKRAKDQKHVVWAMLHGKPAPKVPCTLRVIRVSPRELDVDNLGGCLKAVIDAASEWITPNLAAGRADSVKGLKVELAQEKSKGGYQGIRIEVLKD